MIVDVGCWNMCGARRRSFVALLLQEVTLPATIDWVGA